MFQRVADIKSYLYRYYQISNLEGSSLLGFFVPFTGKELLILKDVMQGLFDPEDEHTAVFGNIDNYLPVDMV
jgi:hypothetical protein